MRIAMVAMSGIRVCDEELLRLGLTLPGFVERSKVIASLPSLGLLTLAALTPLEHEVEYIEMPDLSNKDVLLGGYDLVAISSYTAQIDEAYELARLVRSKGTPVVLGGPHVSVLPDEALAHGSAVVVGEGEPCWGEVLTDAESGRLEGVYDARSSGFHLGDAPTPSFHLLNMSKYNRLTVQTSRGCPHQCDFCASSVLLSGTYKQKPVEKTVKEIDTILEIWDHPFIEFADDNSFVNRDYWKDLLARLEGKRIRWFTETDLSVYEDEELLSLMRRSGCAQVLIGFESPVETGLSGLELRSDWKHRRFPQYREAIRRIQSHGVTVNGCFVIGLDGHTTDIFDQVFDFVSESGLYEVQVTIPTAFPGTPFYKRLEREGRILDPGNWKKCTLFDVNFHPSHMSPEELADGFRNLVMRLYSDEVTNRRRNNYRDFLRKFRERKGE